MTPTACPSTYSHDYCINQLMEQRSHSELDSKHIGPRREQIQLLFNDTAFKPDAISSIVGGVTSIYTRSLNPALMPHERDCGLLREYLENLRPFTSHRLSRIRRPVKETEKQLQTS